MCDHQNRESPLRAYDSSSQSQADSAVAALRQEQSCGDQEEEWRRSVSSLREWICELLIENQELRMSLLNTGTDYQSQEADR